MYLLFDAHISGRCVAPALRVLGHDVLAVDEVADFAGICDRRVIELADEEGRVIVTANVQDFMPIIQEWGAMGRRHSGCIRVPKSIHNEDFALLIAGIRAALSDIPDQQDWIDRVYRLSKVTPDA